MYKTRTSSIVSISPHDMGVMSTLSNMIAILHTITGKLTTLSSTLAALPATLASLPTTIVDTLTNSLTHTLTHILTTNLITVVETAVAQSVKDAIDDKTVSDSTTAAAATTTSANLPLRLSNFKLARVVDNSKESSEDLVVDNPVTGGNNIITATAINTATAVNSSVITTNYLTEADSEKIVANVISQLLATFKFTGYISANSSTTYNFTDLVPQIKPLPSSLLTSNDVIEMLYDDGSYISFYVFNSFTSNGSRARLDIRHIEDDDNGRVRLSVTTNSITDVRNGAVLLLAPPPTSPLSTTSAATVNSSS